MWIAITLVSVRWFWESHKPRFGLILNSKKHCLVRDDRIGEHIVADWLGCVQVKVVEREVTDLNVHFIAMTSPEEHYP